MIVVKFGGTSVRDVGAASRAARIVHARLARRPVVVVSALAGVTDLLVELAHAAAAGDEAGARARSDAIRLRHLREAKAMAGERRDRDAAAAELAQLCDELEAQVAALLAARRPTPRLLDAVVSFGERLSVPLVTSVLRSSDVPARAVDARQVVITDDRFGAAVPDAAAIGGAAGARLLPLVQSGFVPVLGGFIGATREGVGTTLGRGGSDYSAALVGAALGADAIEIWTDVDGMLTADPRQVPDAAPIDRLRADEAAELAAFGAKVLHPATIAPAVSRGIPVHIYNTFRPERAGTAISADAPPRAVTAIAGRAGVVIVRVRTSRMLHACGFLRALFAVFERHGAAVDVVATSEVSVSATVDADARLDAIVADLAELGEVEVQRDRAIVAVVGTALGGDTTTMARALGALRGIHVPLVAVSATGINLTLVVDAGLLGAAMRALHAEFFGAIAGGPRERGPRLAATAGSDTTFPNRRP